MRKSQKSATEDSPPQQQNELQTSLSTERLPEHQNLADELSLAADGLTWSRRPELEECEAMAEVIAAEGYYDMADLADASANERAQLFKRLAETKSGRARILRKILDSSLRLKLKPKRLQPTKRLISLQLSKTGNIYPG